MSTYDDLKAATKSWANRTDITDADFATFVAVTEARMWRLFRLHGMLNAYEFEIDPALDGKVNLPTAFLEFKNIYWQDRHLEQLSIERFILEKNRAEGTDMYKYENKPAFYARYPQSFYVWPTGDSATTGTAYYYATPLAITPSNPTSDLFDKLYDCYLWGCLEQAMMRYGYDERAPLWMGKFQQAVVDAQNVDKRMELSGSIQRINPRQVVYTGY